MDEDDVILADSGFFKSRREAVDRLTEEGLQSDERYAEAEAVYREDLRRNRDNGWSLTGLQLALQKQERGTEAEELTMRLASAFNDADTRPSSSCYCEP